MPAWASRSSTCGVAWAEHLGERVLHRRRRASRERAGRRDRARPPSGAPGPSTGGGLGEHQPVLGEGGGRGRGTARRTPVVPPSAAPAVPSWAATRSVTTESMVMTPPRMLTSPSSTRVRLTALPVLDGGAGDGRDGSTDLHGRSGLDLAGTQPAASTPSSPVTTRCWPAALGRIAPRWARGIEGLGLDRVRGHLRALAAGLVDQRWRGSR